VGQYPPNFHVEEDVPHQSFIYGRMPYNFVADGFHTKKLCADFLQVKCDFTRKTAILRFELPFGGLGATYDVHLRLILTCVVDFVLVLIELLLLDATTEVLRANID